MCISGGDHGDTQGGRDARSIHVPCRLATQGREQLSVTLSPLPSSLLASLRAGGLLSHRTTWLHVFSILQNALQEKSVACRVTSHLFPSCLPGSGIGACLHSG